jgi:hypothetical protein
LLPNVRIAERCEFRRFAILVAILRIAAALWAERGQEESTADVTASPAAEHLMPDIANLFRRLASNLARSLR